MDLVDELSSQPAVIMEDYCHSIEHSIELQVIFLQALFGADIRVLPILCGSFRKESKTSYPEDDEGVSRFLDALGGIAERDGKSLFWVLGVDLAHMGRRYGDKFIAKAGRNEMLEVAQRDGKRINRIAAGDAKGFWDLVNENRDPLKWCGSAPLYTFMKAVPQARVSAQLYQQWNIDPQSVVSFAGLSFTAE